MEEMVSLFHGFVVVLEDRGRTERHVDIDAERAYARALLAVLAG